MRARRRDDDEQGWSRNFAFSHEPRVWALLTVSCSRRWTHKLLRASHEAGARPLACCGGAPRPLPFFVLLLLVALFPPSSLGRQRRLQPAEPVSSDSPGQPPLAPRLPPARYTASLSNSSRTSSTTLPGGRKPGAPTRSARRRSAASAASPRACATSPSPSSGASSSSRRSPKPSRSRRRSAGARSSPSSRRPSLPSAASTHSTSLTRSRTTARTCSSSRPSSSSSRPCPSSSASTCSNSASSRRAT